MQKKEAPSFKSEVTDALTSPDRLNFADPQKTSEAFVRFREVCMKAKRWSVFIDSEMIGDTVVATGFVKALIEAREILFSGLRKPKIDIIVNQSFESMVRCLIPMGEEIQFISRQVDKDQKGIDETLLHDEGVAFDFQKYKAHFLIGSLQPMPSVMKTVGNGCVLATNLFPQGTAMDAYEEKTDFSRYSRCIQTLLTVQDPLIQNIYPQFLPPENADEVLENFRRKNHLGVQEGAEISVVVEASVILKRYGMEKWLEVITQLHQVFPDAKFNIIYNKKSTVRGRLRTVLLERRLARSQVADTSRYSSGSLVELGVFFSTQKMVIGNDTGVMHLSAVTGTPTVALSQPYSGFSEVIWKSSPQISFVDIAELPEERLREILKQFSFPVSVDAVPVDFVVATIVQRLKN